MPAIRRHVHIAAPQRTVWRALTTPEGLVRWLADDARIDGRAGGRVVLVQHMEDGGRAEKRGIIHRWRPTSHLDITWDRTGDFPDKGCRVSFQLARDGDETRLSLVQSGGEVLEDEQVRAEIDEAWKRSIEKLQAWLDDLAPGPAGR